MIGYFTFLAISIACLGLFSLVSFISEQRRKEIGVRKVLGASIPSILSLILSEFVVIVVIANVVAWTLTLLVVGDWLDNFVVFPRIRDILYITTQPFVKKRKSPAG